MARDFEIVYKASVAEQEYCQKCWEEFTTMTEEELESWELYVTVKRGLITL